MPKLPQMTGQLRGAQAQLLAPRAHRVDVRSGRYALRTAVAGDATAQVAAWMSDPVVVEGLNSTGQPMSVDQLRGYIAGFDNVRKNLVTIRTLERDAQIGLLMFDIEPRHQIATFHILVGDPKHRIGEASYTAVRLLLRHLFGSRGVEKVLIEPLSRNQAVVQYCHWLGFRLEGVLKAHRADSKTGARLDQHIFGMTRDEYDLWSYRL